MTFFSEASANSSAIARFKTRQPQTVTSSATATASSEISLDDAYQKAYELAQNIANSQSQHDVDILVQSVDTATIGENTFYLGSSLLKDYIREEDDNKTYTLLSDFTLPDGMNFHIQDGKILHILENVRLTINKNNETLIYGTLYCNGGILVNEGTLVNHSRNTLTLSSPPPPTTITVTDIITFESSGSLITNGLLTVSGGILENTDVGIMNITSGGRIILTNNSTFSNDTKCQCNICDAGIFCADATVNTFTNNGLIYIFDTTGIMGDCETGNVETDPAWSNYAYGGTGYLNSYFSIAQNSILNNRGFINIGVGPFFPDNTYAYAAAYLIMNTNNVTNDGGTININYNNSTLPTSNSNDPTLPPSNALVLITSVSQNGTITKTSTKNPGGTINDYVSTIKNDLSEQNSLYFLDNIGGNNVTQTAISITNLNFPSWITVINQ